LNSYGVVAEANKYFVEFIAKAYQALTDPISRENYEKYGHPDGRQVIISYFFSLFLQDIN
jgi:preprotein translocase subunit Sec63